MIFLHFTIMHVYIELQWEMWCFTIKKLFKHAENDPHGLLQVKEIKRHKFVMR
jgi:hypothetical protein